MISQSHASTDSFSILDVGAGPGEPSCTFKASFPNAKVVCTDVSSDMVDKAKARAEKRGVELDFATCGGDDLSQFANGRFDFVTMDMALMFVPDRAKCLQECARVLKPGGKVLSTVWKENALIDGEAAASEASRRTAGDQPNGARARQCAGGSRGGGGPCGRPCRGVRHADAFPIGGGDTGRHPDLPVGPNLKALEEDGMAGATTKFQDPWLDTAPEVGIVKDATGGFPIQGKHQMIALSTP
jgi:SAM-dependent methyltransferase